MKTKKLELNKETIRDLSSSDLDRVGGGIPTYTPNCFTGRTVSVPNCICGPDTACCTA